MPIVFSEGLSQLGDLGQLPGFPTVADTLVKHFQQRASWLRIRTRRALPGIFGLAAFSAAPKSESIHRIIELLPSSNGGGRAQGYEEFHCTPADSEPQE
jgi:hypothetical protein